MSNLDPAVSKKTVLSTRVTVLMILTLLKTPFIGNEHWLIGYWSKQGVKTLSPSGFWL